MSEYNYLGEPLFFVGPDGRRNAIVTLFPRYDTIVTLPTVHAFQINAFVEKRKADLVAANLPELTLPEENEMRQSAVPAVIQADCVHIRPDPENMALAFQADKLLHKAGISQRRIKYLNIFNDQVREALKRRGQLWRIARLPTRHEDVKQQILSAKAGIGGLQIYYYNSTSGTRWLTCREFSQLSRLDDAQLRQHLVEIRRFSVPDSPAAKNEIAFYMADERFTGRCLAAFDFETLDSATLRTVFAGLEKKFRQAVPPDFQNDDLDDAGWRQRMFSVLVTETDEVVRNEVLLSLSPEFFMQIQWLPGGRIKNGELAFDEVFEEDEQDSCQEKAREFLYNLVREFGDIEYVNIGNVVNSLSRRNPGRGRREVYLAVLKRHGHPEEIVRVIRMQKWGVQQHLDDKRDLLQAMFRSDEYTEYVLDRRFACRYLGMNIPREISSRKICERYTGPGPGPADGLIWSPYFERAYVAGIATDKMPKERFQRPGFALALAQLLGRAAASNMIVGRCDYAQATLFDDGDEVVVEDQEGMPVEIVVADQTGTFADFDQPLERRAATYADPVNRRVEFLGDPEGFAKVYLDAFVERFLCIQEKYRRRRKAFETLFKVRPFKDYGCFADRWKHVLERLDRSDPHELAAIIRRHLRLGAESPAGQGIAAAS